MVMGPRIARCFCCGKTWQVGDCIPSMCEACRKDGHELTVHGCKKCNEKFTTSPLGQYLKDNPCKGFQVKPIYNRAGNMIEVFFTDEFGISEQLTPEVAVVKKQAGQIVGCKINIFDLLPVITASNNSEQIRELQRKLKIEIGTYAAETRYMELILGDALKLPHYPDPDEGIDMAGRTTVGLCQEAAKRIGELESELREAKEKIEGLESELMDVRERI